MGAGVSTDDVLKTAVAGVASEIARAENPGEQVEAFELPTRFTETASDLERGPLDRARKRGRPAGSENLLTQKMREYLLKRGINPLQALMAWSMHTPESLAAELGCNKLEAFRELRGMWEGLAPYFMPKMQPVDQDGKAVPLFAMQFGLFGGAPKAGGVAPWRYLDHEQDQSLIDQPRDVSHVAVSHGEAK